MPPIIIMAFNKKSLYNRGLYNYINKNGKNRKNFLNEMYTDYAAILAANQFDYETPDFNKFWYENSIYCGMAAFYKCPDKSSVNYDKWCCTPAHNADIVNNMGIAKSITTYGSDYALTLEVDKECIIIGNNSAYQPEYYFTVIAEMLTECDISSKALIKWARMCPIPKVSADEEIEKYKAAMNRVLDGEEVTVISDLTKLLSDKAQSTEDNILKLSDEKAIDKMHFFSEYYENLIKRACTYRGIPFTQNSKSSQSLTEELHDSDIFSTLYINDCYNQRKKDFAKCEEFMRANGEEFSFGFDWSESMKIQNEKIKAINEKPVLENEQLENEEPANNERGGENDGNENSQTD